MLRPCVFVLMCVVAVGGCKRETKSQPEAVGTATVTSTALRDAIEDATSRVAFARCEKEMSCSSVPPMTREENRTECIPRVKVETARELNVDACPRGIDQQRLIHCVASINELGCDDPVSRLMELEDCRRSKLCPAASR